MQLTNPLSKTRYTKGLRCPLALYLAVHDRELASEPDEATQARLDMGERIHEMARRYYPEGVFIDEGYMRFTEALHHTQSAIDADASVLYEAAFVHDNVKIRADVLRRLPEGGWELSEVKSTKGFDVGKHLADAAVQLYVLRGSGIDVRQVNLMHLNGDYVYPGGEHDVHALFTSTDITQAAEQFLEQVPADIANMMQMLAAARAPDRPDKVDCNRPYVCEFHAWCHRDDLEPDLSKPAHYVPSVLKRLKTLRHPLHFVDFETLNPALPMFVGTSPYQVARVQWSIHTLSEDGQLTQQEWLVSDPEASPDAEFMRTLLEALPRQGTFVHYSPYERTQLVDIALRMSEWRQPLVDAIPGFLGKLSEKLRERGIDDSTLRKPEDGGLLDFDLGLRVVKGGCLHPVFGPAGKGWSIKPAIKILAPTLPPYAGLAVSSGNEAMLKTAEMLDDATDPATASEIRAELLEYCAQDTMSMVMIYQTLKQELQKCARERD